MLQTRRARKRKPLTTKMTAKSCAAMVSQLLKMANQVPSQSGNRGGSGSCWDIQLPAAFPDVFADHDDEDCRKRSMMPCEDKHAFVGEFVVGDEGEEYGNEEHRGEQLMETPSMTVAVPNLRR